VTNVIDADEPGGREPAPKPLRLLQQFLNTNDREGGRDRFDSPTALARWLRQAGLRAGRLNGDDLARVVGLREALRALLLANNGGEIARGDLAIVNAETARAGLAVRFSATTAQLESRASGLNQALGQILALVFEAMVDGSWSRLKACRRDVCQWVFYDHSRNRSGTWCTMDVCGNRVKTRAYWRRKRRPSKSTRGGTKETDRLSAQLSGQSPGTLKRSSTYRQ
jgi:predicted RNA-binding Zn ribbon-like protein